MAEIRNVNPPAILVQNQELGRTFCTPRMRHQAIFDGERRWLSWDLLRGAVRPGHIMWNCLIEADGTPQRRIRYPQANASRLGFCPFGGNAGPQPT